MGTTETDNELIVGILAGGRRQEDSIRRLFEQCYPLMAEARRRYARLADDDIHSAYHSAIIAFRRQVLQQAFRRESSIKTYLSRIFFNRCIDILRKNASIQEDFPEELPQVVDEQPNALRQLLDKEENSRLHDLLDQVGATCKQILLDSEYWGYSSEEIAQRIGFKNAAGVNSKKYTCLQQLRRLLIRTNA